MFFKEVLIYLHLFQELFLASLLEFGNVSLSMKCSKMLLHINCGFDPETLMITNYVDAVV